MIEPLHVVVRFGAGVPAEAQGKVLFDMEKKLRAITGEDCRVFKDRMDDDSKLRRMMTPAERGKL